MKIIQVAPYFSPHIGGVETHVRGLSAELVQRGHQVRVYTSQFPAGAPEREKMDGFEVVRVKPLTSMFSTPVMPGLASRLKEETGADIIHAHSPPPLAEFSAALAADAMDVPFILTYHCDLEIPIPMGGLITSIYFKTLGLLTLAKCTRIIVTTRSYGSTSRAMWDFDPVVIPNAIDTDTFNPGNKGDRIRERYGLEGKFVVLSVGRIKFHKGIDFLVESALNTPPDVHYLIVGGGDFMDILKGEVKEYGVQDRVTFTGEVSDDDLPCCYAACDVFILPSVSRLEAFGLVGLEAMATSRPVIVSNIPGVREVVDDKVEGLIADPMNSEDLARKIMMIKASPERARKLGRNGRRKVVSRFSWKEVINDIEALYEEVASGRACR